MALGCMEHAELELDFHFTLFSKNQEDPAAVLAPASNSDSELENESRQTVPLSISLVPEALIFALRRDFARGPWILEGLFGSIFAVEIQHTVMCWHAL